MILIFNIDVFNVKLYEKIDINNPFTISSIKEHILSKINHRLELYRPG